MKRRKMDVVLFVRPTEALKELRRKGREEERNSEAVVEQQSTDQARIGDISESGALFCQTAFRKNTTNKRKKNLGAGRIHIE